MKTKSVPIHRDPTTAIALDTISQTKQTLVFCSSKKAAESQAEKIAVAYKLTKPEYEDLAEKALKVLANPTTQCKRLAKCLTQGIAFHHAGLAAKQRELVEESFRDGTITTICSPPTLAAGLDLPAFRAIVRDTKRFGNRGMAPIQVLEYEQMSGRAGRPGKEDYGEAILIAKTKDEIEELTEHYINGEVEDIYSKLAVEPVLRTYVLSLVASKIIKDTEEVYSFFDKTFYAHQFGDLERLHATLDKMIRLLIDWKFLEENNKSENKESKSLFATASELFSKEKSLEPLTATELGKRVSELYLDPLTANLIISQIEDIQSKEYIQLLHILSCTLEVRPLLRVGVKDVENVVAFKEEHHLIVDEEKFYEQSQDDYDNTIKTTLFLIDWINEYSEERLLEKYNIRPGEITAKLQRIDWLLYATDELARMTNQKTLLKEIRNLRTRVKHGVKEELLPLLHFKGIGRVRARRLYHNKIKGINDVKKASPQTLAQLIGSKITTNIKEQVGEKVTVDLKDVINKRPSKHRKQTQLSHFE